MADGLITQRRQYARAHIEILYEVGRIQTFHFNWAASASAAPTVVSRWLMSNKPERLVAINRQRFSSNSNDAMPARGWQNKLHASALERPRAAYWLLNNLAIGALVGYEYVLLRVCVFVFVCAASVTAFRVKLPAPGFRVMLFAWFLIVSLRVLVCARFTVCVCACVLC